MHIGVLNTPYKVHAKSIAQSTPSVSLIRDPSGCSKTADGHTAVLVAMKSVVTLTGLYFFQDLVDGRLFQDLLTMLNVDRFSNFRLSGKWRVLYTKITETGGIEAGQGQLA